MSNVYILEPPTSGKVLLKTTVGDIDVELWTKEAPKTCRNFIQLCLEGYYDQTIFHRVVKGFIIQGGDPTGDGTGGESIYGEPFKDEFHQRLRFSRRGLLAMANAGKDDNGSQFFFTLGPTPELQDKHTIFGKITGNTVFNMLKLEDGLVKDERPVYPHKILKTEVLNNPFTDIEPRAKKVEVKVKKKKEKKPGVKNFKLLSFGAEAEEDEEESTRENVKFVGKGKSTHDVLDDPKLSSMTEAIQSEENGEEDDDDEEEQVENVRKKLKVSYEKPLDDDDEEEEEPVENVRKKLKVTHEKPVVEIKDEEDENLVNTDKTVAKEPEEEEYDAAKELEKVRNRLKKGKKSNANNEPIDAVYESYLQEERQEKKKKQYDEIQKEIETVKKEYHKNKLKKKEELVKEEKEKEKNETVKEYIEEFDKYKNKSDALPKKGAGREQFTLQLLEKFKKKIQSMKDGEETEEVNEEEQAWLKHRLCFEDKNPVLAKDANKKDDEWFEIFDPRNALNKRRRGENTAKFGK